RFGWGDTYGSLLSFSYAVPRGPRYVPHLARRLVAIPGRAFGLSALEPNCVGHRENHRDNAFEALELIVFRVRFVLNIHVDERVRINIGTHSRRELELVRVVPERIGTSDSDRRADKGHVLAGAAADVVGCQDDLGILRPDDDNSRVRDGVGDR